MIALETGECHKNVGNLNMEPNKTPENGMDKTKHSKQNIAD